MEGAHYDYASKLCVDDCGDGKVMIGSKNGCDDGNTQDGDGCNSICQVENGYLCEGGTKNSKDICKNIIQP